MYLLYTILFADFENRTRTKKIKHEISEEEEFLRRQLIKYKIKTCFRCGGNIDDL